jgi:hypothetical protein
MLDLDTPQVPEGIPASSQQRAAMPKRKKQLPAVPVQSPTEVMEETSSSATPERAAGVMNTIDLDIESPVFSVPQNTYSVSDAEDSILTGGSAQMPQLNLNENEDVAPPEFVMAKEETPLTRKFSKTPFIPEDQEERAKRCEEILTMQALGLKKRLSHARAQTAVILYRFCEKVK